jgi:hypothetical protein
MPKVYMPKKSKAGKEIKCGRCGAVVQPGDTYYAWGFRYGGKHYRCKLHHPRPSELTQSKISGVLSELENLQDAAAAVDPTDDFAAAKQSVLEAAEALQATIEEVMGEYEQAAEHFGNQGENQERYELMENAYDTMADICSTIEQVEVEEPEEDAEEEDIASLVEQAFQDLADAAAQADDLELP